jgi:hypothetical protein
MNNTFVFLIVGRIPRTTSNTTYISDETNQKGYDNAKQMEKKYVIYMQ